MELPNGQQYSDEALKEHAPEMLGFLDVEYRLEIHVGGALLTVGEILNLKVEDVVKLDQLATQAVILTVETIPVASVEVTTGEMGTSLDIVAIEGGVNCVAVTSGRAE